jgi:hypothetical protein
MAEKSCIISQKSMNTLVPLSHRPTAAGRTREGFHDSKYMGTGRKGNGATEA